LLCIDYQIHKPTPESFKPGVFKWNMGCSVYITWSKRDNVFTESQNSRGWKGPLWVI